MTLAWFIATQGRGRDAFSETLLRLDAFPMHVQSVELLLCIWDVMRSERAIEVNRPGLPVLRRLSRLSELGLGESFDDIRVSD